MSREDSKREFEQFHRELKRLHEEVEELNKSGKLPKGYHPKDIALYCFIHNAGLDPLQMISEKEVYEGSIPRGDNVSPEELKNWSVLYAEYQAIFREVGNDGSLIKTIKEYGLLN